MILYEQAQGNQSKVRDSLLALHTLVMPGFVSERSCNDSAHALAATGGFLFCSVSTVTRISAPHCAACQRQVLNLPQWNSLICIYSQCENPAPVTPRNNGIAIAETNKQVGRY